MKGRLRDIPWQSIRVRLVLGLLCFTLPMIALLIYNNQYSIKVIHNQVANSNQNLVSVYMKQIDDQLSEAERHMMSLLLSDINLLAMGEAVSSDEYVMAKSAVSRRLTSDLIVYPYIDGFFVYSNARRDMVEASQSEMKVDSLEKLREAMGKTVLRMREQAASPLTAKWTNMAINGEAHIMRLFGNGNVYIGAWVKAKSMLEPLRSIHTGDTGSTLLVDGSGNPLYSTRVLADPGIDFSGGFDHYYLSGRNDDYLVVGQASAKGDFSLTAVVPDKLILENLPYLAKASILLIAIAVAMLPLSLWFLRKVLLLPLQKMTVAMRKIGEGNFNAGIEESPTQDEFRLVQRTFNGMIGQIKELKINVYEEQLSKQRAELKHLQLQINPHFFMNSLNILYNLAQVKQYGLIQEMTLCLVQYFRYMLQSNRPLVLLKDELAHARNFLRIQELRFPERLVSRIDVPDYVLETPIPPLMLHTFLENTIKHAVRMDETIHIFIEAELDELAEEPTVILTVRDSGQGFSDEALENVQSGVQAVDDKGEHIGLWNVRERLRLQYGDRGWMECYNDDPRGAVVEIGIPLNDGTGRSEGENHEAAAYR